MRKAVLISLITLALLLGVGVFYYFYMAPVTVESSNVQNGEKDVSLKPVITLRFNRKAKSILEKSLVIKSSPESSWEIFWVNDKTLRLSPKHLLKENSVYALTVLGSRLKLYRLEFKTESKMRYLSESYGIGSGNAYKFFEAYEKAFPLLKLFPYTTKRYTIGQKGRDYYFVVIFEPYKSDLEQIKKEVYAWFRSKGVDPEGVRIEFE